MGDIKVEFDQSKFELTKADANRGVNKYKYTDNNVFKEALKGAEIKDAEYKKVKDFEKSYAHSAAEAMADFSKKTLTKDKSLNGAIVEVPYAKGGSVSAIVTREITGKTPSTGEEYKVSGFNIKIKEPTVSKSFQKDLKDSLTKSLIK